ncbi:hypothetical protein [Methylobacterium sp. Leaf118]|uniref:hypothetical protein n=1 Tax=Methylobacterium sp. Leaf118 TaxID=2876562 RepID=UPI001E3D22EE|nr:hypothetical protein [Methylobacterium sp. Leaf118]
MRISIDQRDSGWAKLEEWGGQLCEARIFLDGVRMKYCITADEELGEVLVYAQDDAGECIKDDDGRRKEWRYGQVQIVMPGRDEPTEPEPEPRTKFRTMRAAFTFASSGDALPSPTLALIAAYEAAQSFDEKSAVLNGFPDEATKAARLAEVREQALALMQRYPIVMAYLARND